MDNQIKNVIFDFGGVLVDLDKPRCLDAFARLGFHQAAEWVDAYSQQGVFGQLESGTVSPAEFCQEVRRLTGCRADDEQIWQAWNLFLVGIPSWRIEALLALRKSYRIFLLSNTNEPHWLHACTHYFPYQGMAVSDYFEKIFLSYELHQTKPGSEIFRTVLQQADILPEETLFIDDAEANCRTAAALGIHTYCPAPGEDWRRLFE